MPFYEYQCESCGHRFELRQSMAEADVARVKCPECDGPVLRVISLPQKPIVPPWH
jgi:putative FmdB family regulatory protein